MNDDSPPRFSQRLKHAWNAFQRRDEEDYIVPFQDLGASYSRRPDLIRFGGYSGEQTITNSIYNRIAIDVAALDIRHIRLDDENRYAGDMTTYLNDCLTLSPNIDQTNRAFFQDVVLTMFEEGVVAIVPVETTVSPFQSAGFDIKQLRVGRVTTWYPQHVRVSILDERTGRREEVVLPKKSVALVENPLYLVINEPNSTLKRLVRKLALLDAVDEQTGSGKLDIIIQLPFQLKTQAKKEQAAIRRKEIQEQLQDSKYGIAYTDQSERITQLNRPAENNLLKQVELLEASLYGQLGLTPEVFNGKAEEVEMLNYHNRTIEPIISAIVLAMRRAFLTKTARTQLQTIEFFRDPFKLVPVEKLAEIVDKFTRNEIASSNEIRTRILGWKPSSDPKADELRNSNLSAPKEGRELPPGESPDQQQSLEAPEDLLESLP